MKKNTVNKIVSFLRDLLILLIRIIMRIYFIFPIVRNRICFISYEGTKYNCNPRVISDAIKNSKYEIIWLFSNKIHKNTFHKSIKYFSILGFYYLLTSKVIITNTSLRSFIPCRKQTVIINTWHGGGAFKGIGDHSKKHMIDFFNKNLSYFISSSESFSKCIYEDLKVPYKKFLNYGMPRNDVFFRYDERIIYDLREELNCKDTKVVLYAPTFRGDFLEGDFQNTLDFSLLLNALTEKFGGNWICLYRAHHTFKKNFSNMENCIDISRYPNMQPFLLLADCFISDYSSCIYDYALTKKMGFLFIPDLNDLLQEETFKTSPDSWPFPVATSNQELYSEIKKFSYQDNQDKIEKYLININSYDKGKATGLVLNFIEDITK